MALKAIPDTRAVARKGNQTVHAQTKSEKERAVLLPSTLRALQLRNAKGGGQLTKISGREKMEQIAGNVVYSRYNSIATQLNRTLKRTK